MKGLRKMKKEYYITKGNRCGQQYCNGHVEGFSVWRYRVNEIGDCVSDARVLRINQSLAQVSAWVHRYKPTLSWDSRWIGA